MAQDEGPTYCAPLPFRLRLASIKSSRQTMARLTREVAKGLISVQDFKTVAYGMQNLLAYHKAEADARIEERLTEIEDELDRRKHYR